MFSTLMQLRGQALTSAPPSVLQLCMCRSGDGDGQLRRNGGRNLHHHQQPGQANGPRGWLGISFFLSILILLSLSLSFFPVVSIYISIYIYFSLSLIFSLFFDCLCLSLNLFVSLSLSLSFFFCLSVSLSIYLYIYLSISRYLFFSLSSILFFGLSHVCLSLSLHFLLLFLSLFVIFQENVDIVYWMKTVHMSRPGIFLDEDNLSFIYRNLFRNRKKTHISDSFAFGHISTLIIRLINKYPDPKITVLAAGYRIRFMAKCESRARTKGVLWNRYQRKTFKLSFSF